MGDLVNQWQPASAAPVPTRHPFVNQEVVVQQEQEPVTQPEEQVPADEVLMDHPQNDHDEDGDGEAYDNDDGEANEESAEDEEEAYGEDNDIKEENSDDDAEPPDIDTLEISSLGRNWWVTKPYKNNRTSGVGVTAHPTCVVQPS